MTGLIPIGDDGGDARCAECGRPAVGPCARCQAPLCGDCCVITSGGTKPYAVCPGCEGKAGELGAKWGVVLGWFLWPILALFVLVVLMYAFGG